MSLPGKHTPFSHDKGDTQAEEKEKETSNRQPQEDEDQQTGRHCHHQHAAVVARRPGKQDEKDSSSRLNEAPDNRSDYGSVDAVKVCQSCHHLYTEASEVVLSPSRLEPDRPTPKPVNPSSHIHVSMHRLWTVRRYEGLCDCAASVSGGACVCPGRTTNGTLQGCLPRNTPCLKKVKVAALVLAALTPWAFLVTYIVLTSK